MIENQIKCTVKIKKIRYYKDNWGILLVSLLETEYGLIKTDNKNCFIIKGNMVQPNYQDTFKVIGNEIIDPKWGVQYDLIYMCINGDLTNEDSQKIFLSKILTPIQIQNMYRILDNPMDILENENIKELTKVKGIGVKTAIALIERYKEHKDYSFAYVELDKYGLTPNQIKKIVDNYRSPELAVQKIKDNPYVLADEVEGIGWDKADGIALGSGMHPHAPERIKAYVLYFLEKNAQDGDSFISPSLLMDGIIANIGEEIDSDHLRSVLHGMQKVLWWDGDKTKIGLRKYYELELKIAEDLVRISNNKNIFKYDGWKEKIKNVEERQGWDYTEQQIEGIKTVLENQVVMITGLAGCVDCDTEYFNGTEWVKISNYKDNDKVLQYNKDGSSELVNPLKYHKYPSEYLWHFETKYGLDQCLSDEHNVYYITSKNNLYHKTFKEVRENHNNTSFKGRFITTFNYQGEGLPYNEWEIRLKVAIKADGSFCGTNPSTCYINVKKQRKKDRIEFLLKKNNIKYDLVKGTEGYKRYKFTYLDNEKTFTDKWYNCNKEQFEIIYDEIFYWDGAFKDKDRYFTSIKSDADFIQFVGTVCGYKSTINIQDRLNQEYKTAGKMYIRKSIEYAVNFTKRNLVGLYTDKRKDHTKTPITKYKTLDGYKYCFTVPSNMLVLRRNNKIFITGNSGKSSIVAGMLEILGGYSFSQCALSGRAAARMTEITNVTGYTIHRLLGFVPGEGFTFNKDNPLYEDIIIVDEVSMIGGYLFYSLIQAIKDGAKLIMLADIGQLESIGVLNVACDIINSEKIPVVKLDKIHRQAQKSAIITESIKVRNGIQLFPQDYNGVEIRGELQDLELEVYLNKEKTAQKIIQKFKEHLSKVDDILDIQVILPMKTTGNASTFHINKELQSICNPYNPSMKEIEIKYKKDLTYKIRTGDKVMNVRNNYKTLPNVNLDDDMFFDELESYESPECVPIFNGNIGIVKDIQPSYMIIDFNTIGEIIVPNKHWRYIELGYAVTCHKYQGSQSKVIIIGIDFRAYSLLTKEWIYTALTRAQEYCVLCAENKALRYAITQNGVSNKKSHLKDILKNYNKIKMKNY